ncbi:MAG: hypothetical protein ACON4O_08420 [Lentimonas sp.]
MTKTLIPLLALFGFVLSSFAQERMIEVDSVKFNQTKDDWIQVEVELSCNGSALEDALDRRFVENIIVKVYLGYDRDAKNRVYDYYFSQVEIAIMEQGDRNNVYFYLPGLIAKRDQLPTEPMFYSLDITANGVPQETEVRSSNLKNPQFNETFKKNAEAASANADLLLPIYFTPAEFYRGVSDLPIFIRREAKR